jgi:hypothetical protein
MSEVKVATKGVIPERNEGWNANRDTQEYCAIGGGNDVSTLEKLDDVEEFKESPEPLVNASYYGPENEQKAPSIRPYSGKGHAAYSTKFATSKLEYESPADSNSSSFDRADSLSKLRHEVGKATKALLSTVR